MDGLMGEREGQTLQWGEFFILCSLQLGDSLISSNSNYPIVTYGFTPNSLRVLVWKKGSTTQLTLISILSLFLCQLAHGHGKV